MKNKIIREMLKSVRLSMEDFFKQVENEQIAQDKQFEQAKKSVTQCFQNEEFEFDVFESIQKNLEAIYEK